MVEDIFRQKSIHQLKSERLRRGWSRDYIAEQTGIADPKTIGRWERGEARPSPSSLQRLCALFSLTPYELGFSPSSFQSDINSATTPSNTTLYDPTIPFQLFETDQIIGRDAYSRQIKNQLLSSRHMNRLALHGLPGIGKTALALELLYDQDIQEHFCDGVLWASLGKQPDLFSHLQRWSQLLGISNKIIAACTNTYTLLHVIRQAIGKKRLLIIIDDVWHYEDALMLTAGGLNCAYIITTRSPKLAHQFATKKPVRIAELDADASTRLLAHFVPDLATSHTQLLHSLLQDIGGLPLALILIGKYLQLHHYEKQHYRLHRALEYIRTPLGRQQCVIELPYFGHKAGETTPLRNGSLQDTISASFAVLSQEAQRTLRNLAAFCIASKSFSAEAALIIGDATVDVLDELTDAGMISSTVPDRYSIHQTVIDFVNIEEPPDIDQHIITYFSENIRNNRWDDSTLKQETPYIMMALRLIFKHRDFALFIQCAQSFSTYLQRKGHRKTVQALQSLIEQASWLEQTGREQVLDRQRQPHTFLLNETSLRCYNQQHYYDVCSHVLPIHQYASTVAALGP